MAGPKPLQWVANLCQTGGAIAPDGAAVNIQGRKPLGQVRPTAALEGRNCPRDRNAHRLRTPATAQIRISGSFGTEFDAMRIAFAIPHRVALPGLRLFHRAFQGLTPLAIRYRPCRGLRAAAPRVTFNSGNKMPFLLK